MAKNIENLGEFNNEKTFIKLLDRAYELKRLITVVERIRSLDINLINMLSKNGVGLIELLNDHYQLFSIYYRSMFQTSNWEVSCHARISPSAYNFDESLMTQHNEIIGHVNKTLAHQDENDEGRRYVHMDINNTQGESCYLVTTSNNFHIHDMVSHVDAMQKSIKESFFIKFGYELQPLITYK